MTFPTNTPVPEESSDGVVMVLNAGSSSLKFALYRNGRAGEWQPLCRGQIEGIGTSPQMSAKDADGSHLSVPALDAGVRDVDAALAELSDWLRTSFAGARIIGVGHRVVHGGPNHARPVIVTPAVLEELRKLEPLAPLHQPHNLRAIEAVARAPAGRAAGGLLRHELSSRAAGRRRTGAAAAEIRDGRRAALRFPRPVVRVHRLGAAAGRARRSPPAASSSRIWAVAPASAPCRTGAAWTARSASPRSTACAWARGRAPRSGRRPVPLPGARAVGQGSGDDALQAVGAARHSGHQQRHARPAGERREPAARLAVDYFVYRAAQARSARWPPCSADSMRWCSPPASASTRWRSGAGSARRRAGWAWNWTRRRTRARDRGFPRREQGVGLGDPDQRGTDDRPARRARLLGVGKSENLR